MLNFEKGIVDCRGWERRVKHNAGLVRVFQKGSKDYPQPWGIFVFHRNALVHLGERVSIIWWLIYFWCIQNIFEWKLNRGQGYWVHTKSSLPISSRGNIDYVVTFCRSSQKMFCVIYTIWVCASFVGRMMVGLGQRINFFTITENKLEGHPMDSSN